MTGTGGEAKATVEAPTTEGEIAAEPEGRDTATRVSDGAAVQIARFLKEQCADPHPLDGAYGLLAHTSPYRLDHFPPMMTTDLSGNATIIAAPRRGH